MPGCAIPCNRKIIPILAEIEILSILFGLLKMPHGSFMQFEKL
jgi:hypothetical protein